jgi:hypothetical protein
LFVADFFIFERTKDFMVNSWKICFWTPGNSPKDDGFTFGCASHGFCNTNEWADPQDKSMAQWEIKPRGIVLCGTYAEVTEKIKLLSFKPKAAIVVFAKSFGMEEFIISCNNILGKIPIVGGCAARAQNQTIGEILPIADEVSALFISEGQFCAQMLNVHKDILCKVKIQSDSPRNIIKIKQTDDENWEEPLSFFDRKRKSKDVNADNFESMTFSNIENCNIHCSQADGVLISGANVPENNELILRYTSREYATTEISSFISSDNALIFGCAGLRTLLNNQIFTGHSSLSGFMFGELVTNENQSFFSNLMMSKLYLKNTP